MSEPTASPSPPHRPWSLYLFIAWAGLLAFNAGLRLWIITGPLAQFGSPNTAIGWLGLTLAFVAPFGFGASVYGLWELRPWGRILFLGMTTLFFSFNAVGVWLPGGVSPEIQDPAQMQTARLLATARYSLALVIPLVYFNLGWIKILFRRSTAPL